MTVEEIGESIENILENFSRRSNVRKPKATA